MGLIADVEPGDTLMIGGALVRIGSKAGRRTRVTVDAPRDVPVSHVKALRACTDEHEGGGITLASPEEI